MDKTGLYQIGEVAKMFHLSVGTLRHYEKMGLVDPEYTDENTGYRYYGIRQFECLNTIRYLRVLDMPLEQISDFMKNRDVEKLQDMLMQQKEALVRKQEELKVIERKIDNRISQIMDAVSSELDTITLKKSPQYRIACIKSKMSIQSYLDLETSIRRIQRSQTETVAFLGKVGVGIAKEQLINRRYNEYDRVFLILDPEDVYEGEIENLPADTCVALRFCGGHKEAEIQYRKLENFIKDNNLIITGFSREITMIDNGLTDDTKKFVTEIQIPVK